MAPRFTLKNDKRTGGCAVRSFPRKGQAVAGRLGPCSEARYRAHHPRSRSAQVLMRSVPERAESAQTLEGGLVHVFQQVALTYGAYCLVASEARAEACL